MVFDPWLTSRSLRLSKLDFYGDILEQGLLNRLSLQLGSAIFYFFFGVRWHINTHHSPHRNAKMENGGYSTFQFIFADTQK